LPRIRHEPHVTGGGTASAAHPSFLAINTALGDMKASMSGTHHAFAFSKYAHRNLDQEQYLFNRRFDLRRLLKRLARAFSLVLSCPLRGLVRLKHLADQELA